MAGEPSALPLAQLLQILGKYKVNPEISVPFCGGADTSKTFSDPHDYEDILPLLDQACCDMNGSQLIPVEFSLSEAMSCLEIMDPKMDSGMALQKSMTFTAAEAYEANIIPKDSSLTIPQVILIMDNLLQAEISFYQGNNLLQTIFTCLYVHDLTHLQNPYLLAYCYITLKLCSYIRNMVQSTDIVDEEDFNGIVYSFRLPDGISDEDIIRMVNLAENDLTLKISKAKGKELNEIKPLQDDPELEIEYCEALLARLRLKRGFFNAHLNLEKSTKKGLSTAKKSAVFAHSQSKFIRESHAKYSEDGVTVPEGLFDPSMTRRILFQAPPNTISLPSFVESMDFMDISLQDLVEFTKWPEYNTIPLLMKNLENFSDREPSIISRCRLYRMLLNNNKLWGLYDLVDLVKQNILDYGIVASDFECEEAELVTDVMTHVTMLYLHCQFRNLSRKRSKLMLCFQELGKLQGYSEVLDLKLYEEISGNPKPTKENPDPLRLMFSNYVVEFVLNVMIQYVKLGLALELYNAYEYPVVFWYLDFLYGRWSVVKNTTMEFLHQQKLKNALTANRNTKKKRARNIKKQIETPVHSPDHFLIEAQQSLYRASARLITALHAKVSDGKDFGRPSFEFGSDNLRFFQRFGPFHHLRMPPCLWYSHFESSMSLGDAPADQVINYASEVFGFAKKMLDTITKAPGVAEEDLPELKRLTRVAISNQINILRLGPGPKIICNFETHKCFPIITFVAK